MKTLIGMVIALFAALPAAQADISVTGLAGFNFHNPSTTPETNFDVEGKFSYGALLGFGTPYGVSIETGLMNIEKDFGALEYDAWEIPLLVRYNIGNIFSVGAGGYYQIISDDFSNAGNSSDNDIGLKASVRAGVPIVPKVNFVVEGQYAFGLTDLAAAGGEYKNREIRALAGFAFGF